MKIKTATMNKFIVYLTSGEPIIIEADYFKVKDEAVHFFKDAEEIPDIYVSAYGTVVIAEKKLKKIKGFD